MIELFLFFTQLHKFELRFNEIKLGTAVVPPFGKAGL